MATQSAALPTGPPGPQPGQQQAWHDPVADASLRETLTQHIVQIFAKKKGQSVQNWGSRLAHFVKRLEDQLYASARTKEEYMNLDTLEQRLQYLAIAARTGPGNAAGGSQNNPAQQQPQQGQMPQGMMPKPGQAQGPGMGGAGGSVPFGQGGHMGQSTLPGFMPTSSTNGANYGQSEEMRNSGVPNGTPGLGALDGPGSGAHLMHGFPSNSAAPGMMRNGQKDMPFGLPGQQGSGSVPPTMPRTSMNGVGPGPNDMTGAGSVPMNFMNNGGMGNTGNGMIPVNNGLHSNMLGMPGNGPAQPGSGMMPVNGMMQPPGGFNGMGVNSPFPLPGAPQQPNGAASAPRPQQQPGGMMPPAPGAGGEMAESAKTQYVQKQQRWLLFLRHCAKCRQSEADCQLQAQCKFGKQLWQHILNCTVQACPYPRCTNSKDLLKHHQKCQSPQCPICAPVKEYVRKTRMQQAAMQQQQQQPGQPPQAPGQPAQQAPPGLPPPQLPQPPAPLGVPQPGMQNQPNPLLPPQGMPGFPPMPPMAPMPPMPPMAKAQTAAGIKREFNAMQQGSYAPPPPPPQGMRGAPPPLPQQNMYMQQQQQEQQQKRAKSEPDPTLGKNTYTSLLETFTADQIRLHKDMIFNASSQQRTQQAAVASQSDLCTVCACTKLLYEPPVIYCSTCGLKIKRGQTYYATPPEQQDSTQKGCWCHQCFTEAKDRLQLFGVDATVRKADLVKRKNDEEIEEPWVQCDMCEAWVHQICGLFNKGRNNQTTHYLCPDCLIQCETMGKRHRIEQRPQSMLESKDLPHCELSKFLENRVILGLEHERQARAQKEGKAPHDVPTAEGLTIRVVNNIVKKCEVKPKFLEAFQGERDVTAFPYKQRVILMFQNIDGVDVCLFTMYVQEYGEDCPEPNRNCVYLSYLDSVKYFRPEVTAVLPNPVPGSSSQNVALRTFVYHQILIGYLSYVKMLGFTQMYIWACPPMQGDDYILYCHPHKQKTPRSDRLRNWYLDMLRQARSEGIVIHLSTLWDTYFPGGKDHRMEKCSAVSIPYLEGDYFPGEAENQLDTITNGPKGGAKGNAKGSAARAAKGKRYGLGPATTDDQLMERLGEILGGNMKEDFIVVHLQEVCTFCRKHVFGGGHIYRYRSATGVPLKAPAERKFEGIKLEPGPNVPTGPVTSLAVCETCFMEECVRHAAGLKTRLPAGVAPHDLSEEKLEEEETQRIQDPDQEMESEFFETRQSFLSLCQGNHYQFDTLRRAKHSSMMVLYHLHNPAEPAFSSTCNMCQREMEAGTGYRCTKCQDFDLCADCKQTRGHEHPLVPARRYDETRMRLTDNERRERNESLQRTMALLVHACSCQSTNCTSTSCRKVQELFQHALHCQVKMNGNCVTCKKMFCLLTLHAKSCTKADCNVPRCKDFKEMRRRQAARQEDQRRKAYQKMLRHQYQLQQQNK